MFQILIKILGLVPQTDSGFPEKWQSIENDSMFYPN
jgi:hypothetical protein